MEEELRALRLEVEQRREADAARETRMQQQEQAILTLHNRMAAQEAQHQPEGLGDVHEEGFVERIVQAVRAGGGQPSRLKTQKPPTFSGDTKGDVDDWVFRVEQYYVANETPQDKRVVYAASLLTGSAASWWRTLWETNAHSEACNEWGAFKEALRTQFKFISAHTRAREELYATPVHAFREMSEYCRFFRSKVLQAGNMTTEEQIFVFCRSLNPQMRADVLSKQPDTLNACMHIAEVIAAAQREWRNPMGTRRGMFKRRRFRTPFLPGTSPVGSGQGAQSGPVPMELGYVQSRGQGRFRRRGTGQGYPGATGRFNPNIRCFVCKQVGHPMSKCPRRTQRTTLTQVSCVEPMETTEPTESSDTAKVSTTTVAQMREPEQELQLEDIIRGLTTTPQLGGSHGDDLLDDYEIDDLDFDALMDGPDEAVQVCNDKELSKNE